jgi:hypothetical protein
MQSLLELKTRPRFSPAKWCLYMTCLNPAAILKDNHFKLIADGTEALFDGGKRRAGLPVDEGRFSG